MINYIFSLKSLFYVLLFLGAVIMLINMFVASSLKKKVPGGFVGKWLSIMILFMFFFFIAEAGGFFFVTSIKNKDISNFLIASVLFFGSVFVGIVNRFIYHLMKELEVHK